MLPGVKHLIEIYSSNRLGQSIARPARLGSVITASSGTSTQTDGRAESMAVALPPMRRRDLRAAGRWRISLSRLSLRVFGPTNGVIRHLRDTPIWKLEAALKCRSRKKGRYAPPVQ